jgi:hypothetical protein
LSAQKKPLKIQQTAPTNIRRNIPGGHPSTLQHVGVPNEQKRKSEPSQKIVQSIAAIQKPQSSSGQAAGNNERKSKAT